MASISAALLGGQNSIVPRHGWQAMMSNQIRVKIIPFRLARRLIKWPL